MPRKRSVIMARRWSDSSRLHTIPVAAVPWPCTAASGPPFRVIAQPRTRAVATQKHCKPINNLSSSSSCLVAGGGAQVPQLFHLRQLPRMNAATPPLVVFVVGRRRLWLFSYDSHLPRDFVLLQLLRSFTFNFFRTKLAFDLTSCPYSVNV